MLRTRVRAGPVAGLVMSVFFALALTIIQIGDRFIQAWTPKIGRSAQVTLRVPYGPRVVRDRETGRSELHYEHVRILVPRGTVLRRGNDAHETALGFEERHRPPRAQRMVALFAIFFGLSLGLTAYLRKFGHQRLRLLRVQAGVLGAMCLLAVAAKAAMLFTSLSELWIPIAAVPLWVAGTFDRRTAFVVTVVLSFSIASFVDFDLIFLSILLVRGMAATLFFLDRKQGRQMIVSGTLAGAAAVALYVAVMVTFEGVFDWRADLAAIFESQLIACFGGGLSAGLLAAALRAPAARLLGYVPRERLLDLSGLEQPLMLRLQHEAPGTFEHSRAMANLAEQSASAIGADALLTRVGAYYHDLGKTTQPKYFVENLGPDERSPHDDLDPEVSADAIMAHVVLGTKILREGGVPESVVEFAYTHHGTALVEYFWNKCLQQGNPKDLDPSAFRYPGMRPQTRETAIVMLVDSIEAASRTIDPPDRMAFETMVQRIVFTKLADGQLDDCGLTMNDLHVIVNRMVDTLVNMHHHRIKYQWQAKRAQEFGVPSTAVSNPWAAPTPTPPPRQLPPAEIFEPPAGDDITNVSGPPPGAIPSPPTARSVQGQPPAPQMPESGAHPALGRSGPKRRGQVS